MFAMGKSTISILLCDVVHAINVALRSEIAWPIGARINSTEADFRRLCGLLGILEAINGKHFPIAKLKHNPIDYYYFKTGRYSMNC